MSSPDLYDLLIIGGGINGAGIARDVAGRGLKVLLCEKDDLGAATSSASTKLIHGGLRYLETFDFRLVHEALAEREVMLGLAPHIVRPMRFVLPYDRGMRPRWMIRLGLWIYDHLGGRKRLPASSGVNLRKDPRGAALKSSYRSGFVYSDCWVDDARLVVLNAMDAAERGAQIMTRTECLAARRTDGIWQATLRSGEGEQKVAARVIVNATGPWAGAVLDRTFGLGDHPDLRLVKGSHFVVPRLFAGEHAFILQNPDGRVVFIIPYEQDYSLIGTTEVDHQGDPAAAEISAAEIDYLCTSVNRYLATPVDSDDIIWSFTGVRPLQDEEETSASRVTRDYELDLRGTPPVLTVIGGKITTHRKLAEHTFEKLAPYFATAGDDWTARAPLPGGDIEDCDMAGFEAQLASAHPWLPKALARRFAHSYGTRSQELLDGAASLADLGRDFGGGLYEAEVRYLVCREWARTAEDILWRRTKLGLHVSHVASLELEKWLKLHPL